MENHSQLWKCDTSKAYRTDQQYFVICVEYISQTSYEIWRFLTNDFARSMVVLKRSKALKHGGYSVFAGVGQLACNATCVFAFGDSERLSKMTGMHRNHRHDWPYLGSGTKSSMVEATRLRGKHIKRGHNQRAQQQWQWHFLAQRSNREKVQGHNFRLKRLRQAK